MAHSTDTPKSAKPRQNGVRLRIRPASPVDHFGDVLSKGDERVFTEAEAAELLRVRKFGAPVFERVKG